MFKSSPLRALFRITLNCCNMQPDRILNLGLHKEILAEIDAHFILLKKEKKKKTKRLLIYTNFV